MDFMYLLWILFGFLPIYLFIIIKGPSIWDRLLGMNLISAKIMIIIVVFASIFETAYLLDFAIVYALLGFICTIFISRFILERIKGRSK